MSIHIKVHYCVQQYWLWIQIQLLIKLQNDFNFFFQIGFVGIKLARYGDIWEGWDESRQKRVTKHLRDHVIIVNLSNFSYSCNQNRSGDYRYVLDLQMHCFLLRTFGKVWKNEFVKTQFEHRILLFSHRRIQIQIRIHYLNIIFQFWNWCIYEI